MSQSGCGMTKINFMYYSNRYLTADEISKPSKSYDIRFAILFAYPAPVIHTISDLSPLVSKPISVIPLMNDPMSRNSVEKAAPFESVIDMSNLPLIDQQVITGWLTRRP